MFCSQTRNTDPDFGEIVRIVELIELRLTGLINDMCTTKNTQLIPKVILFFRVIARSCRLGQHIQSHICRDQVRWLIAMLESNENTHFVENEWDCVIDIAWKCLVNVLTQNIENQKSIWLAHREFLIKHISTRHRFVNISCAAVYNIYLNGIIDSDGLKILEHLLNILREEIADPSYTTTSEYVQYYLEYFISKEQNIVKMYRSLKINDRLVLMHFVAEFLRPTRDETLLLSTALILHFVKEFKLKSDCVLKTVPSFVDKICPSEVCALLEILAICSSSSDYHQIVSTDGSLFLNAGCLLQTINSLGQKADNVFTPISKLAQIAPNSREASNIERDISYELKSLLVRLIGNLAYRSPNNQTLAREMDIILAVLNCTNMDARNPRNDKFIYY